jgi:DNA-binding MarR family transcriptional regulator
MASPEPEGTNDPQAEELVSRLFWLTDRLNDHFREVAAKHSLTPTQAISLRALEEPLSMGQLAQILRCEPSNVTQLVGQLEEAGLVRRSADDDDRRVRKIRLTSAGRKKRLRFGKDLFCDLPFDNLSHTDARQLLRLVRQLATAWPGPSYRSLGGGGQPE